MVSSRFLDTTPTRKSVHCFFIWTLNVRSAPYGLRGRETGRVDFVDEDLVLDGWAECLLEAIEESMERFAWPAYQGHQHIVFITGNRGVSQHGVIADAAKRDIAFTGLEERFDVRPGCRSRLRCRRALYAASACCAASSGTTFHGSNSSIRLIG